MTNTETLVPSNKLAIPGYQIFNELGKGGMATVYLAEQECFGRKVALKIMSPDMARTQNFSERFLREARILAGLSHPHIIAVYDVGIENQHHYYAMEFHDGGDLKQRISNGLSTPDCLLIIKQLALALDYAHGKGYIHRDVKPDNVLFREDGSAVLTDFGIARAANSDQQLTQTGKMIGTPRYMSPEQAKGQTLDARSDIYSLGIVFYEMLTGHVPFVGEDAIAIGIKHIKDEAELLPIDVEDFQPIIDRLLAKDPEDRFQSGEALIRALEEVEFYHSGEVARGQIDTVGMGMRTPVETDRQRLQREIEEALDEVELSHQSHKKVPSRWPSVILAIVLSVTATTGLLRPDLVEQLTSSLAEQAKKHPVSEQMLLASQKSMQQIVNFITSLRSE